MSFATSREISGGSTALVAIASTNRGHFRTAKDILTDLVNWANVGFDTTTNQRLRPSLILIINNDDRPNVAEWCDTDYATQKLLSQLSDASWFEEQKKVWRRRGKTISNSTDLLNCYYDGLRVISIPSDIKMPAGVLLNQYKKLYREIRNSRHRVQKQRQTLGMKVTAEKLSTYMEKAFGQLAMDFEAPIDFYDLVRQVHEIPKDPSGHFIDILRNYAKERDLRTAVAVDIFTGYLASCIALRILESPEREVI